MQCNRMNLSSELGGGTEGDNLLDDDHLGLVAAVMVGLVMVMLVALKARAGIYSKLMQQSKAKQLDISHQTNIARQKLTFYLTVAATSDHCSPII